MSPESEEEYEIRFHPEFFRDLRELDRLEKERLVKLYPRIKENPTHFKHLSGGQNCYSVRVGDLRVIYYLEGQVIWFLIVERRGDVYEEYLKRLYNLKEKIRN